MTNAVNILVTGASGFTGRHFIAAARERGYTCTALCHQDSDQCWLADHRVTVDLRDADGLRDVLKDIRPSHVLHMAAISFVAHDAMSEFYETNLIGSLNLLRGLEQCGGPLKKIIVTSSANIYGNATTLPITEDAALRPANHYGVSKYAMELAAGLLTELPLTIVRPFNYTGVGQSPNFIVPKLVNAFREKRRELELGNIDVSRDFSDVRDVVEAYLRLLEMPQSNDTYNICSGRPVPLRTIIENLSELSGHDIKVTTNPRFVRNDEIKTLFGSPQKLERAIGQYRRRNLHETLQWMLNQHVDEGRP